MSVVYADICKRPFMSDNYFCGWFMSWLLRWLMAISGYLCWSFLSSWQKTTWRTKLMFTEKLFRFFFSLNLVSFVSGISLSCFSLSGWESIYSVYVYFLIWQRISYGCGTQPPVTTVVSWLIKRSLPLLHGQRLSAQTAVRHGYLYRGLKNRQHPVNFLLSSAMMSGIFCLMLPVKTAMSPGHIVL